MKLTQTIVIGEEVDTNEAKNWKPEWLIFAVCEGARTNVTKFLEASGVIMFDFNDLIQKMWNLLEIEDKEDEEKIIGILACLCMRRHLEELKAHGKGTKISSHGMMAYTDFKNATEELRRQFYTKRLPQAA